MGDVSSFQFNKTFSRGDNLTINILANEEQVIAFAASLPKDNSVYMIDTALSIRRS